MKFFVYSFIVFMVGATVFIWFYIMHTFKKRRSMRILSRAITTFDNPAAEDRFISTYIIRRVADLTVTLSTNKFNVIFQQAAAQNFGALTRWLESINPALAAAFEAQYQPQKIGRQLQDKKELTSLELLVLGSLQAVKFEFSNLSDTLMLLEKNTLDKQLLPWQSMLQARAALNKGDLSEASIKARQATLDYQKNKDASETAEGYFLLGEIYRAGAEYDMAQMMYKTADYFFKQEQNTLGAGRVSAMEGMIMVAQNRFDEAKDFFKTARHYFKNLHQPVRFAEVINQLAIMSLLQKKFRRAHKYASIALDIHLQANNAAGRALSIDLLATSLFELNDYEMTKNMAKKAQQLYLKQNNYSAYQEMLLAEAQACYRTNELERAMSLCQQIIKVSANHQTCFHLANAYALLGLCCQTMHDLENAEKFYRCSLDLEAQNKRYAGMAIDYCNLAMIEEERNNQQGINDYMNSALSMAEKSGDEELSQIVREEFKKMI